MAFTQKFIIAIIPIILFTIVSLYLYYHKLKKQIHQQKDEIIKLTNSQNQLYSILEQEFRKPILTFRDVAQKIDFLVAQEEFDTLKKLGHQLDTEAGELKLLLENLLTWAKSYKGTLKYNPQPLPIKLVIDHLEEVFLPIAKKKSIPLHTTFEEAAHLNVDSDALFLILKSIIYQIIKFSKDQEPLTIDISTLSKLVDISIKSKAIPVNLLDEKNNNTRSGFFNPTLIKELIHLNRGQIQYDSSQVPTIHFSFPRA